MNLSLLFAATLERASNPEINPSLIEKSKRIVDLAKDLETNIITTHIGVVTHLETSYSINGEDIAKLRYTEQRAEWT